MIAFGWWHKPTACAYAGGIAVTLAGHPFDTAKVRLQTQSSTNPIYCELFPLPEEGFAPINFHPCQVAVSCQV